MINVREKRKEHIAGKRDRELDGKDGGLLKTLSNREEPIERVIVSAEDVDRLEKTLEMDGRRRLEGKRVRTVKEKNNPILNAPFAYSRRRGDEARSRALTANRRPTKLERFRRKVLGGELTPLPRLQGLYNAARSVALRPVVRQQSQFARPQNKLIRPVTKLEVLGQQVEKHGDRVPLRKVTYYLMGRFSGALPEADKLQLPAWVHETLSARGYSAKDAVNWIKVMRAPNATQGLDLMEQDGGVWPKFLIQYLLYSSASRSQSELVKIFTVLQDIWDSFDQEAKLKALARMAELSAKKLPQGLPRVANLLIATEFEGSKAVLRICNKVLATTAAAYHIKQHHNYTSVHQLRNYIDESMITVLSRMADKDVHVKVSTLRKVSAAKLAEDAEASIEILQLAKPKRYVDLLEDMKGQEEDLALAYEVAKTERQLSSLEHEFLKGHLLGRVTSKEMVKRLRTIQNWRVSTEETFSAWLEFLERRRTAGPAPKDTWISILQMCHDEWTFPTPFWEEAFDLLEQDHAIPNTTLLCLVLKGIKEEEVLDRILERATTTLFQRMNDQIWQVYLQRLCIKNAPRALEIFLSAHTGDDAVGTMDTLNIMYWNILLNGLYVECRKSNDTVWVTRAFDLLNEMDRLSIFPTQQTLSAVCKLGDWGGDKVQINGVPAWKAALNTWHDWIVRPEDFSFGFNLPGIARVIPSQPSWRKFIRLAGNYGEYGEVFDATWAMLRFGVQPDWETLLDIDVFMQLSGDEERTLAVREMFREWLGRYPSPREVIWHYRRWLRAEVRTALDEEHRERLAAPDAMVAKRIEGPQTAMDVLPDREIHQETVVQQWTRREGAKPWFEQD